MTYRSRRNTLLPEVKAFARLSSLCLVTDADKSEEAMGEITTIGRTKLRILKHSIQGLKEHSRLKIAVVIAFALAYWFGSFFLFRG